jgi:hypothetical protein
VVAPPLGADAAATAAAALHGLAGAPGGAAGGAAGGASSDALLAPGAPPAGGAAPAVAPASGGGVSDLSGISAERLRDGRLQYRVDVYAPRDEGGVKRKRKYVGKYPTLEAAAAARDGARAELRAQGVAVSDGGGCDDSPRYYGVTRLAARRVAAGAAPPPVQRWQAAAPRGAGEKPQYVGCFFSAELAARAVDTRRREWGATGGFNFPAPGESGYARACRRTPDALQAVPFRSHKSGQKKPKTDDDAAAAGDDADAGAGDAPDDAAAAAVEVEGVAAGEPGGPGTEEAADGGTTWNALLAA